MAPRLPVELIYLTAQYATVETQGRLSVVSRGLNIISMPMLYRLIPYMSIPRATQCLVTLSKKLEVARLVYSFFLALPPRQFLRPFYAVLDRALGNMSNLQELSLILGLPITRNFPKVEAISKELTKLTCYTHTQDPHFLPSLLLDQPGIEELNILCGPAAIANLSPEALTALKCLHSPIWLLPTLLPSRLSHLSRLVIQEPMNSDADLRELSTALEEGTSPESMELDICMDLASCLMTPEIVSLGLSVLGSRAPFIHHLTVRLRGPIQQVSRVYWRLQDLININLDRTSYSGCSRLPCHLSQVWVR
jgi:hypothetical protein